MIVPERETADCCWRSAVPWSERRRFFRGEEEARQISLEGSKTDGLQNVRLSISPQFIFVPRPVFQGIPEATLRELRGPLRNGRRACARTLGARYAKNLLFSLLVRQPNRSSPRVLRVGRSMNRGNHSASVGTAIRRGREGWPYRCRASCVGLLLADSRSSTERRPLSDRRTGWR